MCCDQEIETQKALCLWLFGNPANSLTVAILDCALFKSKSIENNPRNG